MKRNEIKVKNHPGIYKIVIFNEAVQKYLEPAQGNKYRAVRSLKGIKKTKCFETLREALQWKNGNSSITVIEPIKESDNSPSVESAYERYKECVFPTIEKSSIFTKEQASSIIKSFFGKRMSDISPEALDATLVKLKKDPLPRRYSFDKELTEVKSFCNHYRENYDYKFINPVLKRHFALGKIKELPERNKKMRYDEFLMFLQSLKSHCDPLFYDLAVVQFYTAARISEMVGLQKNNVNFNDGFITIKDIVVWDREKKFSYLKSKPKNGEVRFCHMTDDMRQSLLRQFNTSHCDYVFQQNGLPLKYRGIQFNYEKALKKVGLFPKYSSTHFLRHTMASITRAVTGSADKVQSITGQKSMAMVEHYAGSPSSLQKGTVLEVENFFKNVVPFKQQNGSPFPHIPTEQAGQSECLIVSGSKK